jgi:hypothetical protein
MFDIIKIVIFSILAIFDKQYRVKTMDIIKSWSRTKKIVNFITVSLIYLWIISILATRG